MTGQRETTSNPDPPFRCDVPGATLNGAPSMTTLLVPTEQDQVFLILGGRDEFTVSLLARRRQPMTQNVLARLN